MADPGPPTRDVPVVEPEVLESLDEAGGTPFGRGFHARRVVVASRPGCGCLAVPFAVVAGVAVSSFLALLWVARLFRAISEVSSRVARAFGAGRRRSPPGA